MTIGQEEVSPRQPEEENLVMDERRTRGPRGVTVAAGRGGGREWERGVAMTTGVE